MIGQYALVFRRRIADRGGGGASPETIYKGLRDIALSASQSGGLPLPPREHPDVFGVVIDIPASGGFATLVGLTDNTTSLYTSTGGGTIGAGTHSAVATATHALLAAVQQLSLIHI